ncbi:hypothetical protein NXT3_PA00078 (plasmid) [Sinorhizobium fredii]|uniref:Uncharacterized protein n=1 Tax=Rhizobium fredii TaxID=380 RepID=A0A2L0HA67_RHIFR|nr:hypothetical protein NXT3_PA00078 [Sinorhizobium fredii]
MIDVRPRLPPWRVSTVGMGNFSGSNLPQSNIASAVPENGTWPTDEQAKVRLFTLSKWDLTRHGNGSKVIVNRCIPIAETEVVCELSADLNWITGDTRIEAVFQGKGGDWKMIAAKNR